MPEQETVTVSILDKDYQVSCKPEEVLDLKRSASLLDQKMREVKSSTAVLGLDRIAVIAGLNMANELLGAEEKRSVNRREEADQLSGLGQKIDSALNRFSGKKRN